MAVEAYFVILDVQSDGAGYDAVGEKKKLGKAEKGNTIAGGLGETVNGQFLTVGIGKLVKVEAESNAEAIETARQAYGSHGGVTAVGKFANLEFKST